MDNQIQVGFTFEETLAIYTSVRASKEMAEDQLKSEPRLRKVDREHFDFLNKLINDSNSIMRKLDISFDKAGISVK